ncbi:hypothetical protein AB0M80_33325 [Amycolatopsis sp. NPDC051045]|uniref:NACHT domain-containing protein n=1 Tax=Amycolatopsis sp. NPDC051045 TaxID=3156922 RepID=UPI003422F88D
MTDYRLDGLSARTFEHLVQALALNAVSSTVTPFGDGPDGGREATFDGATNYGSMVENWDGYGVIQAKFLQRPKTTSSDGQWIIRELRKELRKYKVRRGKKGVEYYIIATNVTLTAVDEVGTKDAVFEVLAGFAKDHGLKGFDVWDYDKIRILIDDNDSIRKAYAAWITPGDVLMQLSSWLAGRQVDYHKLIVNYLQKELMSDQFARLEQAGHTAEEAIPLAQVFVDLPIASRAYVSAESMPSHQRDELQNFVQFIAGQAEVVLTANPFIDDLEEKHHPAPGRFVLIGGPGQGKTTLGQYVCQMFRCALLKDVPQAGLDPEARKVMRAFAVRLQDGSLPTPGARRLPLRVVLSDFAAALAEERTANLLTYLTEVFCKRTNAKLSPQDFEALIERYPSILVLDGLDEVPASSNRDQVLSAVQDFSIDIYSRQMDVLIIATSRPQGYSDDFSPRVYRHLWLTPLPAEKALEYGENLARVRFSDDADRIEKVVGRLRLASSAVATARIMRTPLQVTILTLLVDRRGQLPQERWALFDEYYALIYQRETERDIPAAEILRERKDDIDAVHRLVGLLLQVESEVSGSTDARLTTDQFSKLVEIYLASEGNEGESLQLLRDAIIDGAANRLVFLVGLESGQVGFEIRSLQEFMAAEGLLDAEDGLVQNRLRSVAGNANWRNVTVFAAGKIFAERRYLRDTVESICVNLNEDTSDRASQLVFAGSELALDLLEDGPVARQPAKCRSLIRVALRLLQLADTAFAHRLAAIYQESLKDIYVEELARFLGVGDAEARKNSWVCLDSLMQSGVGDLELLATRALNDYPPDVETLAVLLAENGAPLQGFRVRIAERLLPMANPSQVRRIILSIDPSGRGNPLRVESPHGAGWLEEAVDSLFVSLTAGNSKYLRINKSDSKIRIGSASLNCLQPSKSTGPVSFLQDMPSPRHPGWNVTEKVALFEDCPSRERLADAIRAMASARAGGYDYLAIPRKRSWPVEECLLVVMEEGDSETLAEAAVNGLLGDKADWENWQSEWMARGVSIQEVTADVLDVVTRGQSAPWFPIRSTAVHISDGNLLSDKTLVDAVLSVDSLAAQRLLIANSAQGAFLRHRRTSAPVGIDPRLSSLLMDIIRSGSWMVLDAMTSSGGQTPPVDYEWASAVATGIGASGGRIAFQLDGSTVTWLWAALQQFPKLHNLIVGMVTFSGADTFSVEQYGYIASLPLGDNIQARLARAIIGIRLELSTDIVWEDIRAIFREQECRLDRLFDALGAEAVSVSRQIVDLLRVYDIAVEYSRDRTRLTTLLRNVLRRRQSHLIDREKWRELGFSDSVRGVTVVDEQD